jgi:hypothetical protein
MQSPWQVGQGRGARDEARGEAGGGRLEQGQFEVLYDSSSPAAALKGGEGARRDPNGRVAVMYCFHSHYNIICF